MIFSALASPLSSPAVCRQRLSSNFRRKGFRLAERGSALPLAMIVMLLCSILGFTLVAMGMTEMQISGSWKQYSAAFYAAEAGIESGVVALRTILASTPAP